MCCLNGHGFDTGPSIFNGGNDLAIAGTAAEYATERGLDLAIAGGRIGFQQRGGGHQHSGRADAALHRAAGQKRTLQGTPEACMRGDPFHRHHMATLDLRQRHHTGASRGAIDPYGAGAAIARVAAHFCAGAP